MLLSYICLIDDNSHGGAPYFTITIVVMSSECLEVSEAFNRSTNANHVGRFWLYTICRSFYCECTVLKYNSNSRFKLAFHAVFANYFE